MVVMVTVRLARGGVTLSCTVRDEVMINIIVHCVVVMDT